jgi:hypothetical protein
VRHTGGTPEGTSGGHDTGTAPGGTGTGAGEDGRVEKMRDGVLPAAVVAAAVIAFVAYVSFQGASHAVEFAVTSSDVSLISADSSATARPWRARGGSGDVMVVQVTWQASESIGSGSYAVMVATPRGWRHLGCRPECEWTDAEGLSEFGDELVRRPYPLAATFEAEEAGHVRVAFRSPPGVSGVPHGFVPVGWLVQTNGDDVLGAEQIPLKLRGVA